MRVSLYGRQSPYGTQLSIMYYKKKVGNPAWAQREVSVLVERSGMIGEKLPRKVKEDGSLPVLAGSYCGTCGVSLIDPKLSLK